MRSIYKNINKIPSKVYSCGIRPPPVLQRVTYAQGKKGAAEEMGEGKAKREKGRKERRSLRRAKEDGGKGVAEEFGGERDDTERAKKGNKEMGGKVGFGGQGGEGRRETAQFGQEPEQEGTKPGPHYQFQLTRRGRKIEKFDYLGREKGRRI